ncbi:hypothetical protein QTP70_010458 [Hemibagrus guttatus]|uniref:Uncharacterized protein n=1 Tax=Hemibagrus guttatus TaxID=175788 RepID=A0AAE0UWP5_9TELE|nr:hypothetical protein QTP70_010458 [Hemibagrus guttatus]
MSRTTSMILTSLASKRLQAKLSSVLILLNLLAAFDTVNHPESLVHPQESWNSWSSMGMVCFLPGRLLISDTTASAQISACLVDISSWIMAHKMKLNPSKTELLLLQKKKVDFFTPSCLPIADSVFPAWCRSTILFLVSFDSSLVLAIVEFGV